MAPGGVWIGNVEVNVVHVLVRDRAGIKLEAQIYPISCIERHKVRSTNMIVSFCGPSSR